MRQSVPEFFVSNAYLGLNEHGELEFRQRCWRRRRFDRGADLPVDQTKRSQAADFTELSASPTCSMPNRREPTALINSSLAPTLLEASEMKTL